MATIEHAVVIAGGGPTGLMLAGELALAGVDVAAGRPALDGARCRRVIVQEALTNVLKARGGLFGRGHLVRAMIRASPDPASCIGRGNA